MNDQPSTDSATRAVFRSPLLLHRDRSLLVVIDVQEKLMPMIDGHQRVQWNIERLLAGAAALQIPCWGSEQYPAGLGHTVEPIRKRLPEFTEKRMFSCRECGALWDMLAKSERRQIVVAGIESHVCVLQTALDLQSAGWDVYLPVDAVGSRAALDHRTAVERMAQSGITPTTTEGVLFEWCETSAAPEFKSISQLVRQTESAD